MYVHTCSMYIICIYEYKHTHMYAYVVDIRILVYHNRWFKYIDCKS